MAKHSVIPLGDAAAYVEFSETLDLAVNAKTQRLAQAIRALNLPWLTDVVPTLGGVALHFDLQHVELPASPTMEIAEMVEACLAEGATSKLARPRLVEVPVCYAPVFGLDLALVANTLQLSEQRVIELHCAGEHRVLMMGFSPGQPYLGGLDPSLSLPRKTTPRTKVPAGSIAIANTQTVIYPFATPGGWSIIGRTPLQLFDVSRTPACLLAPDDRIQFVSIDEREFERLVGASKSASSEFAQGEKL